MSNQNIQMYTTQVVEFLQKLLQDQRQKVQESVNEIEELRREAQRREMSKLEMVAYLQNKMKQNERQSCDVMSRLSSFLQDEQNHLRSVESACTTRISNHEQECRLRVETANKTIEQLKRELEELQMFRDNKDKIRQELSETRENLQNVTRDAQLAAEKSERHFYEEFARVKNESQLYCNRINQQSMTNAENKLSIESKQLRVDNIKLKDELIFHEKHTSELLAENEKLKLMVRSQRRDLELLQDNEKHFASRGAKQKKEIRVLCAQAEANKRELMMLSSTNEEQLHSARQNLTERLDEANVGYEELRRAVTLKNKELHHLRSLAAVIVGQRTDTETFFLQALDEVKRDVGEKKHREQNATNTNTSTCNIGAKQDETNECVKLEDLDANQRERVLKILFKRICKVKRGATAGGLLTSVLPPHSFDEDKMKTEQQQTATSNRSYTFLTERCNDDDE